jgi:hypothetical protein
VAPPGESLCKLISLKRVKLSSKHAKTRQEAGHVGLLFTIPPKPTNTEKNSATHKIFTMEQNQGTTTTILKHCCVRNESLTR